MSRKLNVKSHTIRVRLKDKNEDETQQISNQL